MPAYRLVPAPRTSRVLELDASQRQVVDHHGSPLLVLGGPGTGKTTTMVEAVVERIERRGVAPEEIVTFTSSRKAAHALRDRIAGRLGRTLRGSLVTTFHSFALGLLQHYRSEEALEPLHLLDAPVQDVMVQELLRVDAETHGWPEWLAGALHTRGFAQEVQALMARARELRWTPHDLVDLGVREQRTEYVAAGRFFEEYLSSLEAQQVMDHGGVLSLAVDVVEANLEDVRRRFRSVLVDEFQEIDAQEARLLRAVTGDGRDLVVFGDPDQSILGFRGADVSHLHGFGEQFGGATVVLRHGHRQAQVLAEAAGHVVDRLPLQGPLPQFRRAEPSGAGGRVDVTVFDSEWAEAQEIAEAVRRAHLDDDVPWSEIAVVARSSGRLDSLMRELQSAGVPVEIDMDDLPLRDEPAVATLLDALALAVDMSSATGDRAYDHLVSPVGGVDPVLVRRAVRELRARDGGVPGEEWLRRLVRDPELAAGVTGEAGRELGRASRLLAKTREAIAARESPEEVLWLLWDGAPMRRRLLAALDQRGAAERSAHRDLDAVVALFDFAAKMERQLGRRSVADLVATLRAQQVPGDTLAAKGVRGESVLLMTPHRAKGRGWDFVVVAHVQEDEWPNLRRRNSLLRADRLGAPGEPLLPPASLSRLLSDERRLFHVAFTRARRRVLVTAVAELDEDGAQPSRFLTELGVEPVLPHAAPVGERYRRVAKLTLDGVVADLRRAVTDEDGSEAVRVSAASRLAQLAEVVPGADPSRWWGLLDGTDAVRPTVPEDEPIRLSASAVERLIACPAQWFLSRRAGGETGSGQAAAFGTIVHAVVEAIESGELAVTGVEDVEDVVMPFVDEHWGRVHMATPWEPEQEREALRLAFVRFLRWRDGTREGSEALTFVAQECDFSHEITLPDGERVVLNGRADRLEVDAEGRVVVIDLKTNRKEVSRQKLEDHTQLHFYQLAVAEGAFEQFTPSREPGAAALLQLRLTDGGEDPLVQASADFGPEQRSSIVAKVAEAAATVRSGVFPARPDDKEQCRYCQFTASCPAKTGSVLS